MEALDGAPSPARREAMAHKEVELRACKSFWTTEMKK
jgi:hypothetical protein